jgi:predicted AAA+ superfamily ATPase
MINDEPLAEIISEWSFFDKAPSASVLREVLNTMPAPTNDLVSVIQGVRRCGKSTLLCQIMEHLKVPRQNCFFVNFEDPRLVDQLNTNLLDSVCQYADSKCSSDQARYFFFDEIQNVEDWPKWFHRKLSRPRNDYFFVTGSNANLLSGKIASALTGRHISTQLFPFSLEEFIQAIPQADPISAYFDLGGFPRAITFPDPAQLLRQYIVDIVERDVRRDLELGNATVLMQLIKLVYESAGSETSQRNLSRTLGISPDTIGSYLEACEAAYLIQRCSYFTYSERQRVVRNRKYYPIDIALRHALVGTGKIDNGKKLETLVFLELRRLFSEVAYWRGVKEIDFVVSINNSIVPIQVSWEGEQTRHREAFDEFKKEFPKSEEGRVINRENCLDILREFKKYR